MPAQFKQTNNNNNTKKENNVWSVIQVHLGIYRCVIVDHILLHVHPISGKPVKSQIHKNNLIHFINLR